MMKPNEPLIREVMGVIKDDSKHWEQNSYIGYSDPEMRGRVNLCDDPCDTTYCFAGWAAHLSGWSNKKIYHEISSCNEELQKLLGLNYGQCHQIFYFMTRDYDLFERVVADVTGIEFKRDEKVV